MARYVLKRLLLLVPVVIGILLILAVIADQVRQRFIARLRD